MFGRIPSSAKSAPRAFLSCEQLEERATPASVLTYDPSMLSLTPFYPPDPVGPVIVSTYDPGVLTSVSEIETNTVDLRDVSLVDATYKR